MAEEQTQESNIIRSTPPASKTGEGSEFGAFYTELLSVMKDIRDTMGKGVSSDGDDKARGSRSAEKTIEHVNIVDISESALKLLKKGEETESTAIAGESKSSGVISQLVSFGLLGTGFITAISSMLDGGPLQGINKIVARGIGKALKLDNFISKVISKLFDSKLLKNLNVTIANVVKNIFGEGSLYKSIAKLPKTGFLKSALGALGKLGKPFLKRVPIIGTLISISSAITRMKNGQIMQGMVDLASGVATMFPGVGTAVSIGLDLLNASMDITNAKTGGSGMEGLMEVVPKWFSENWKKIPIINTLGYIGEGIGSLLTGDFEGFLLSMLSAQTTIPFVSDVYDLLFGERDEEGKTVEGSGTGNIKEGIKNFTQFVKDRLTSIVGDIIKTSTSFLYDKLPKKWVNAGLDFLGLEEYKDDASRDAALMEGADKIVNAEAVKQVGRRQQGMTANQQKVKIRSKLSEQGYSKDEINDAIRAIMKQTDELKKMNETTQGGGTTAVSQNNTSTNTNIFANTSDGVANMRHQNPSVATG